MYLCTLLHMYRSCRIICQRVFEILSEQIRMIINYSAVFVGILVTLNVDVDVDVEPKTLFDGSTDF